MIKRGAFFEAIAVLIGTVIGAGILGIPYVIYQSGYLIGFLLIILIGLAVLTMNLFLGEIALKTKGSHQLTGYAQKYLGKTGKRLMAFSMIFGIYGGLTAYIIGEGTILSAIFGGSPLLYSILFFIIASLLILVGIKIIKHSEFLLVSILLFILLLIMIFSFGDLNLNNLTTINLSSIVFPYGVILFALLGTAAIPEMKEVLIKKSNLKKAILSGSLLIIAVYSLFSLVVLGACGSSISQIATICLGNTIGHKMIIFGNLFAIFAMGTSFLTLGLALKDMYNYDYKLNKKLSWALAVFIPLIIFLLGFQNFIKTIAITGGISGGLAGILIALMYRKVKKDKITKFASFMSYLIIILFSLGILYTLRGLI